MDNNSKVSISRQILALTAFITILVLVFTIWTDSSYFVYLIWNIFLAFLPFFISSLLLLYKSSGNTNHIIFVVGLFFWLILFPNAPYVVTDIIHLGENMIVPIWFDIILLFSSAWVGLYLGIQSLYHIEQLFLSWYGKRKTNILVLVLIFLSSFGIYLGRFLRWNSWDIIAKPDILFKDIFNIISHPLIYPEAYITTILFFIFITGSYNIWKYLRK